MVMFLLGISFSLNVVLCAYIYFTRLKNEEEFNEVEVVNRKEVKEFFSDENKGFH